MKRYRIINSDFDTRAQILETKIEDHWEEQVKESWRLMKSQIRQGLAATFGPARLAQVEANLIDLGAKPFSVLAFHNKFLEQVRNAFIVGSYYPALTGACALGERILNHMIIRLREYYRDTPEYKRIYRKSSFDDWDVPIGVLQSWGILLPQAAEAFRDLKEIRNLAIHFNPATDQNDRPMALEAIRLLGKAIEHQFASIGTQPWFIPNMGGEAYIAKAAESQPFIREVYIPNGVYVGPFHRVEFRDGRFVAHDDNEYEEKDITDDEFRRLRQQGKAQPKA